MDGEKIVVSRRMPLSGIDFLKERGFMLNVWDNDKPAERSWLLDAVSDAKGLFCSLNEKIDAKLLDAAPKLKVIAQLAVGYDNIDLNEATKRGIVVTHTPYVLSGAVADLTWSLILSIARRIPEADRYVRNDDWKIGFMPIMLPGRNVYGKVLGILGMGRIGSEVAKRSLGFDMRVIYHNRNLMENPPASAEYVDFETLLVESDFLVILVPLAKETEALIGFKELSKMKKTAYLINVSRGNIVDQDALYKALKEGIIAGAGLDVLRNEPIKRDEPLLTLPNVVFTPHIGSDTFETRGNMSLMCAKAIYSVIREGKVPDYPINKDGIK